MKTADRYLGYCVECKQPTARDFCVECVESGVSDCSFGRCYNCRDGDHDQCIGVPCRCDCPTLEQRAVKGEREAALAKLTPRERMLLTGGA